MKKIKSTPLYNALYGLIVLLICFGVVGMFASASGGSIGGSSSVMQPSKPEYIISAGAYTFDATLSVFPEGELDFYTGFVEDGSSNYGHGTQIGTFIHDEKEYFIFEYDEFYTDAVRKEADSIAVYGEGSWGEAEEYRTIYVPYSQTVDKQFYMDFKAVTTAVKNPFIIPAGTYTFVEKLPQGDFSGADGVNEQKLNFTFVKKSYDLDHNLIDEVEKGVSIIQARPDSGVGNLSYKFYYEWAEADDDPAVVQFYEAGEDGFGWLTYNLGMTDEELESGATQSWMLDVFPYLHGEGIKTITIPRDSNVSAYFMPWFKATTFVGEGAEDAPSDEGSSGEDSSGTTTEGYKKLTAGTYTLNESVNIPSFSVPVNFTSMFTYEGVNHSLTCSGIYNYNNNLTFRCTSFLKDGIEQVDSSALYLTVYQSGTWAYDGLIRNIVLASDYTILASRQEWFLDNTEPYIEEDPPAEDGSFAETPTYAVNTIYAGTYRFNDVIDFRAYPEMVIDIPFVVGDYSSLIGSDLLVTCDRIWVTNDSDRDVVYHGISSNVDLSSFGISFPWNSVVYTHSSGWNLMLVGDAIKTITVLGDVEVDEAFYTWFTSNTTMLIKAATYRWNDVLNIPDTFTQYDYFDIPFTVSPNIDITDDNFIVDYSTLWAGKTIYFNNKSFDVANMNYIALDSGGGFIPYINHDTINPFDAVYELYTALGAAVPESIKGWGQIITISEDQYVPTDFGIWFVCNAGKQKAAASDTSEVTATVLDVNFSEVCYIHTNKDDLMSA